MLEIQNLCASYGAAEVLHGVSLRVAAGEIVALIGANGAGKTTLAKTLAGVLSPSRGRIVFENQAINRISARERIARGIAQVPEGRQIIAGLTVEDNLRLAVFTQRRRLGAAAINSRLAEIRIRFPVLAERMNEMAGNLSGGQQQMLAIARALMVEPRLVVLDEPSLGLSPVLVGQIFGLIADFRRRGLAVLLSEQNARMSLAIADRAYVMEMGCVVLEGTGQELLNNPAIAERYLGVGTGSGSGDDDRARQRRHDLVRGLAPVLGRGGDAVRSPASGAG
jgi:branched-chain amino acid transport system ATP-binding protein